MSKKVKSSSISVVPAHMNYSLGSFMNDLLAEGPHEHGYIYLYTDKPDTTLLGTLEFEIIRELVSSKSVTEQMNGNNCVLIQSKLYFNMSDKDKELVRTNSHRFISLVTADAFDKMNEKQTYHVWLKEDVTNG